MALLTASPSLSPSWRTSTSMATMRGKRQSWIAGLYFNNFVKHHFAARGSISSVTTTKNNSNSNADHDNYADDLSTNKVVALYNKSYWSKRRLALILSLWVNLLITVTKLVAYLQTGSLSVLASLLDNVLDVISQLISNYTE